MCAYVHAARSCGGRFLQDIRYDDRRVYIGLGRFGSNDRTFSSVLHVNVTQASIVTLCDRKHTQSSNVLRHGVKAPGQHSRAHNTSNPAVCGQWSCVMMCDVMITDLSVPPLSVGYTRDDLFPQPLALIFRYAPLPRNNHHRLHVVYCAVNLGESTAFLCAHASIGASLLHTSWSTWCGALESADVEFTIENCHHRGSCVCSAIFHIQ